MTDLLGSSGRRYGRIVALGGRSRSPSSPCSAAPGVLPHGAGHRPHADAASDRGARSPPRRPPGAASATDAAGGAARRATPGPRAAADTALPGRLRRRAGAWSSARAASGSGWSTRRRPGARTYLVSGSLTDNLDPGTLRGLLALRAGLGHRRLGHHAVLRALHPRRQRRHRLPRHPGAGRQAAADPRPARDARSRTAASASAAPTPSRCGDFAPLGTRSSSPPDPPLADPSLVDEKSRRPVAC